MKSMHHGVILYYRFFCSIVIVSPIFSYCSVLHISVQEGGNGASPSLEALNVLYILKNI